MVSLVNFLSDLAFLPGESLLFSLGVGGLILPSTLMTLKGLNLIGV